MLLEKGYYDPDDEMDRHMLAFVFIPVIQKEMDIFRETIWNSHRVRSQKEAQMPKGIPNHLYSFPESYGAQECGMLTSQAKMFKPVQYFILHQICNVHMGTTIQVKVIQKFNRPYGR